MMENNIDNTKQIPFEPRATARGFSCFSGIYARMKKSFCDGCSECLGTVIFCCLCFLPLAVFAVPRLAVPTEGVQFGEIAAGEATSRSVEIRNVSPFPIAFSQVKGCCGAEVSLAPMRIEPQASATLAVRIKPADPGVFSKDIRIFCDDPECPVVTVPVSGVAVASADAPAQKAPLRERIAKVAVLAVLCAGAAWLLWKGRDRLSLPYCISSAARLGVGGAFLYAGAVKLCDVDAFASLVSRYELLPDSASGIVALSLPAAECLAGFLLVFSRWVRASAGATAAMLAVFIVALAQAAVRGLDVSCGCFGGVATSSLGWAIARDVAMLAATVWLAFRPGMARSA